MPHPRRVRYPTGDGNNAFESDAHAWENASLMFLLSRHFKHRDDVYVAGRNFIYYTEGDNTHRISPDVYVVFGVKNEIRPTSFKVWRENNRFPSVVFEITSLESLNEDLGWKAELYL